MPRSRWPRWLHALALLAGMAVAFLVTLRLSARLLREVPASVVVPWSMLALAAVTTVLLAVGAAVHQAVHWRRPLQRLGGLLGEILEGRAAIDELSRQRGPWGGLQPLAGDLQRLMQSLREGQAKLAELNQEMRQRIAHRTDALERTIGLLRQQATRDALTGLYNRRMLEEHLPAVLDRCRAQGQGLCALMIDLDHFKRLNDTLGHAAGDDLLRDLGQLIRSAIRSEDMAFRCGGDEFVVLLPGAGRRAGEALAQRLADLVYGLGQTMHVEPPPGLSIGVCTLAELAEPTADRLLAAADQALYREKAARRK